MSLPSIVQRESEDGNIIHVVIPDYIKQILTNIYIPPSVREWFELFANSCTELPVFDPDDPMEFNARNIEELYLECIDREHIQQLCYRYALNHLDMHIVEQVLNALALIEVNTYQYVISDEFYCLTTNVNSVFFGCDFRTINESVLVYCRWLYDMMQQYIIHEIINEHLW